LKKLLLYIFLFLSLNAAAQKDTIPVKDTLTFAEHFTKGTISAHWRTFFMSTLNDGALKDDYSLASGVGLGLLTKPFHGFQLGANAFFTFNLLSSNIQSADPLTLMPNRYELGLYDIQNPYKKYDIASLQKLFIRYTFLKNNSIEVGRIDANNPFVNPQDGRMRPTAQEGVWIKANPTKKLFLQGGYYWTMSPRSTTQWYKVSDVVGIYPSGVNVDGSKSNYYGNIKSAGLAIANARYSFAKHFKLTAWDAWFFNVMNTAIVNLEYNNPEKKPFAALMYIHQDAINDGGNANQNRTFINKGAQSNTISATAGYRFKHITVTGAYTFISGDGRYLMPREWGRDWLYTFMPRERNEGAGGVNAATIRGSFVFKHFSTALHYGYFHLPDVKNYRLNKYGMPSYHQINYEFTYYPAFFEGMALRLLVAYKINAGETYNNLRYVYNKVNMVNFNLVLDFKLPAN
jgi:hypothetical protein